MNVPQPVALLLGIALAQALVWTPIVLWMRRSGERIREEAQRSGERILVGPERADYQGWVRRFGVARTMGTLALTDRRVWFRRPLGRDIVIPLTDIAGASDTADCGDFRHSSEHYLALNLRDDSEVVFRVGSNRRWLAGLRGRGVETASGSGR